MHSVTDLFEAASLQIENSFVASDYRSAKGPYSAGDGEKIVESFFESPVTIELRAGGLEIGERVKEEFLRRWRVRAKSGIVDEAEGFYIVVGRKSGLENDDGQV